MKNELNIFCNNNIKNFLHPLLSEYELTFMKLDVTKDNKQATQANIIIINNKNDSNLIDYSKLNDNYLIISNLKNLNLSFKNKSYILNTPLSISSLKNKIENFVLNLKIKFQDISIYNEKLINHDNNKFCYLTKIESEILIYLVKKKETSKDFIKENILNIKSNVDTNSLESHLTRIRKKMNRVKTKVKIHTKNEKLYINA